MVKWTEHALAQVRSIYEYIAQDSPLYAKRVAESLVSKTIGLGELPNKGRKVPELNDEAIREVSQYTYRILYEIKPTHIEILAVIHKRRDLQPEEIPREQ
ncbi:MAG: type II toxin-antitoxin system RelE/ParE family toxin [Marinospirillum sp.]|uniref:type II toxin-antitoxin system RelE/ParE family toxin n=1 Tax=Marinospirillum sp. TaxID=2183934 RepID=UPI0019DE7712|nr:type II toxin-antitoxin system RelE/ParE family toxin [Marinospirillum sp.]MBE0506616.1 type II toxin-antitoxin system RelE/ParE family toxin [Marinospirillum sp.]